MPPASIGSRYCPSTIVRMRSRLFTPIATVADDDDDTFELLLLSLLGSFDLEPNGEDNFENILRISMVNLSSKIRSEFGNIRQLKLRGNGKLYQRLI